MRKEIKEWINNKKEKALASHFFKFLSQPTFGTSRKNREEPNFTNVPLTSILVMTNWNNYDR